MSEAGAEASAQSTSERIDRTLLAESKLYEVPYRAYADMSPREKASVKARWAKKLRDEAKRRHIDPDEFLAMTAEARDEARQNNPEQQREPRRVSTRYITDDTEDPAPAPMQRSRQPVAELYDEGLTDGDPHSPMDEVPATEDDPKMRTQATLGEVRPSDNEDLAGWQNPKNLRDIYARYTIGDGQHFIRVERVDPKVWQQIPCAGYLGEIREPITEPEFHSWYGGRVYALTVYGPDPRGRKDPSTGLPVIKAKTEPFRYTVPLLPPNLAVLPGTNPTRQQQGEKQMHPFMNMPSGPMGHMPTTQADANMFKTSIDFMQDVMKRGDREREELRAQVMNGSGSKEVIAAVTETTKATIDAQSRAAETEKAALRDQLTQERNERRRLEEKIDRLTESQQQSGNGNLQGAMTMVEKLNPAKTAEEQVARLREGHKEEVERIRDGYKETIAALKERHDDEMKRSRENLNEVQSRSREKMDELERRMRDREKELRDQMDQQRRDEREVADRRVKETEVRFEDRMKDLKDQHSRELRMQEGQFTTRVDTNKSAWEMQLLNAKEKAARLEEDLEAAREEAAASKDPVQVLEKAKASAEALGFKKDENEPQGAWERFAATAGMGLGKALESIDTWLPRALAARTPDPAQAAAAAGQKLLPNGMPAPQAAPRPQPRPAPRRQVAWATQGSIPMAGQQPVVPPDAPTVPFVQAQPTPMAQPSAPPTEAAPQQQPAQEQQPETNGQAAPNALYGAIFPDEIIVQFRAEVERAINAGMTPDTFADRFVTAYPEPSAMLVQAHKPEDFIEIVKKMPGGVESIITRRDGKRWIEKLWMDIVQKHRPPPPPAQEAQQGAPS